jgi:hypothetical protein
MSVEGLCKSAGDVTDASFRIRHGSCKRCKTVRSLASAVSPALNNEHLVCLTGMVLLAATCTGTRIVLSHLADMSNVVIWPVLMTRALRRAPCLFKAMMVRETCRMEGTEQKAAFAALPEDALQRILAQACSFETCLQINRQSRALALQRVHSIFPLASSPPPGNACRPGHPPSWLEIDPLNPYAEDNSLERTMFMLGNAPNVHTAKLRHLTSAQNILLLRHVPQVSQLELGSVSQSHFAAISSLTQLRCLTIMNFQRSANLEFVPRLTNLQELVLLRAHTVRVRARMHVASTHVAVQWAAHAQLSLS